MTKTKICISSATPSQDEQTVTFLQYLYFIFTSAKHYNLKGRSTRTQNEVKWKSNVK